MIVTYLESRFKQGNLYNSWLINTTNIVKALEDLQLFIKNNFLGNNIPLDNHTDYQLIKRCGSDTRDISVKQIRDLQEFLNKTSAISGYKVVVIYQADLMNLNAANSCLKVLEDTPRNSYIFLLTTRASNILTTIRSRCAKINIKSHNNLVESSLYIKFITAIVNYMNVDSRLAFIKDFSDKNRELWGDFSNSILYLMNRIIKKSVGINIELTKLEGIILNKFSKKSPEYLIEKFTKIRYLIDNTINYDLDLRTSCILCLKEFA